MGAAPFHFWFPGVIEGLSWINRLALITWQKIAPLILLSYNLQINLFITLVILLSVLIGSLGGLNQTSLRKILAYSSINHLGWLIAAMILGENLWILYISTYIFLSTAIVFIFNAFKLSHINQIFAINNNPPVIKFALFTALLSLGGLPPFLGFMPKWLVIQSIVDTNLIPVITIIVVITLLTLFYYLRLRFGAFILTYTETLWNYNYTQNNSNYIITLTLSTISILGLPICSLLYWIL